MRRKFIIPALVIAAMIGCFAVWSPSTSATKTAATVSFVGYTNDSRDWRRLVHTVTDNSSQAMAMFRIDNHGGHILSYVEGYIELKTNGQWQPDPERLPWTN